MKNTCDLEGAPHAQSGQSMGGKAGHVAPVKPDAALIGLQQPCQRVEKSTFSCPIGTDDRVELPMFDLHIDALQSLQAAKAFGNALHFQHKIGAAGTHASTFLNRPTNPVGISNTNSTMMMPMAKGQYSVLPLIITSSTT